MVAALLGHDPGDVELVDSPPPEPVPYDLPGDHDRQPRPGSAATARSLPVTSPFRALRQARAGMATWSPEFELVPEELHELAAAPVPWRTEAAGLPLRPGRPASRRTGDAAGAGRSSTSTSSPRPVWIEDMSRHRARSWDVERYVQRGVPAGPDGGERGGGAARLTPRPVTTSLPVGRICDLRAAAARRRRGVPAPVARAALDDALHARLRAASAGCRRTPRRCSPLPRGHHHGDACPNNLLPRAGPATSS